MDPFCVFQPKWVNKLDQNSTCNEEWTQKDKSRGILSLVSVSRNKWSVTVGGVPNGGEKHSV